MTYVIEHAPAQQRARWGSAIPTATLFAFAMSVLLTEVFPTKVRYTASAVTYNLSYAIFGGTAPFVATWLIDATGLPYAPAIYLSVIAIGSFCAALLLPET
ncbi:MFS transporter [Citricoccus sp. NR2]|uniref:MFS transporter n=1 Tax=Citricoccus sp. NR2 TaxID=3004095 RepID=UPI0022DDE15F|nr:MFS transporter [Citricoccus sp. NR2]WBL20129.1 MFS transporter [Citricoccus sp. NR2]